LRLFENENSIRLHLLPDTGFHSQLTSARPFPDHFAEPLGILPFGRYGAPGLNTDMGMAETIVPHFHNDLGVPVIEIGAKEFMCVGALPPFDHPHVYCDMGGDNEFVCPYCSTLYRYDPSLAPSAARPAECALRDAA
jgi:uncharacterized Zn-finger protein